MSCYNLKLKIWRRDAETRVYINARFVELRNATSYADGAYLCRRDDGSIGWRHGFRTGPDTVRLAENVAFGVAEVIRTLDLASLSFDDLLVRIEASLTAGGNFSLRRYEKKFQLCADAA